MIYTTFFLIWKKSRHPIYICKKYVAFLTQFTSLFEFIRDHAIHFAYFIFFKIFIDRYPRGKKKTIFQTADNIKHNFLVIPFHGYFEWRFFLHSYVTRRETCQLVERVDP